MQFLRDFIIGDKDTGRVSNEGNVVGGEDPSLAGIVKGAKAINYGEESYEGSYEFPSETIEAWEAFMETAVFRGEVDKVESALREEGAEMVEGVGTALGSITVDKANGRYG